MKVVGYVKPQGLRQNEYIYTIFADAKEDVVEGADISGIDDDDIISSGSVIYTADGDVAFRKSDDSWHWVNRGGV